MGSTEYNLASKIVDLKPGRAPNYNFGARSFIPPPPREKGSLLADLTQILPLMTISEGDYTVTHYLILLRLFDYKQ